MDRIDQHILRLLAANARIPVSKLSSELKIARSTVQARLERLERNGSISGYTVKLGAALNQGRIKATVLLSVEPKTQPAVISRLKVLPEVEAAHTTSGRFDLLLQVAANTTDELDRVLDKIGEIQGVKSSESLIHLSTRIDRAL